MSRTPWRDDAQRVVRRVIAENPDVSRTDMKKLLSEAYPFGPREMSPYKTWLKQVKAGLDFKYGYEMTEREKQNLLELNRRLGQGELEI